MGARSRRVVGTIVASTLLVASAAGCGSNDAERGASRPRTPAQIEILAPTPNQVTGSAPTVRIALHGAHLVPGARIGGAIRPREGHIHVSVDGSVVAMINRLDLPLTGLTPGEHTVEAEFVASDHLPFANRVVAATSFRVA